MSKDLQKMLKFGLVSLLSSDTKEEELNIKEILGATENSKWVVDNSTGSRDDCEESNSQQPETIYQFEG